MQSYRKSVIHVVTVLAFLPRRRNTILGVEFPFGSFIPEGVPTFAKGYLGIGSHIDVKEESGLVRVPYIGREGENMSY